MIHPALKYGWYLFICSIAFTKVNAQRKYTISGYISDKAAGERLNGTTIEVEGTANGAITNDYGFYSLSANPGDHILVYSFVGYKSDTVRIKLTGNKTVNISLQQGSTLSRITINSTLPVEKRNDISTIILNMNQVKKLPSFLGEKDLLKAIQLLPGVQAGQEGTSGIYVRGGGPDENLILLDGVPVYNVNHLFGFVSLFTPEAIQSVELVKGGFPARYGGRLSSVLDIKMKEGDLKHYKGDASIGLLSSKITFEGPIKKDVSSFIISARRSYWDVLATPFISRSISSKNGKNRFGYYFQDLNAKLNYKLDKRNKIYLSLYTGADKFHVDHTTGENDDNVKTFNGAKLQWNNITGALRWNLQWGPKFFSNATLSYSRFNYLLGGQANQQERNDTTYSSNQYLYRYHSGIRDWSMNWDADYYPTTNHSVKFGVHMTTHRFTPGASLLRQSEGDNNTTEDKNGSLLVNAGDYAAYAEDNITLNDRFQINIGLHAAAYRVDDTTFLSLQPRLRGRYLFNDQWSVKFGFASMQQPLHLLTTSSIGLPTDLWVPATVKVKPETSFQYTIGVARSLPWNLDLSIEGYYKHLNHVIAYKDGANFTNTAADWEDQVETGQGNAYGMELFLQRKAGRLTGWLGYTLSWNNRQFDHLNEGRWFPYKYDHRHDIKLVLSYTLNDHIDLSATWVYNTGNAITLPVATYPAPENDPVNYGFSALFSTGNIGTVSYIQGRNDYRMRAFHRLNIGIDFKKEKRLGTRIWNISIYNAYCRQNPFFYYYEQQDDESRELKQLSLLPIMPSVSYTFRFKSI